MTPWPLTLRHPWAVLEKRDISEKDLPVRVVREQVADELYRALNLQLKKPDAADAQVDKALSLYEKEVLG